MILGNYGIHLEVYTGFLQVYSVRPYNLHPTISLFSFFQRLLRCTIALTGSTLSFLVFKLGASPLTQHISGCILKKSSLSVYYVVCPLIVCVVSVHI